jgi:hypothetical protein
MCTYACVCARVFSWGGRYLLTLKADVNKTTYDKIWCPLNIAAHRGFLDCVQTLVQLKADVASLKSAVPKAMTDEIRAYLAEQLQLQQQQPPPPPQQPHAQNTTTAEAAKNNHHPGGAPSS